MGSDPLLDFTPIHFDHGRTSSITAPNRSSPLSPFLLSAPTVMPDNLRATPMSTHAIRLTWSVRLPTADSDTIEIVDGFYIGYRAISGADATSSSSSAGDHQSFTYKTISNTPLQPLYSKVSAASKDAANWNGYRSPAAVSSSSSSSSSSFLIKLHNQSSASVDNIGSSMSRTAAAASSDAADTVLVHHQYYEHIVDTLARQTQYQ